MSSFLDKHRCPITHEVMNDPVLAPDTYNYERRALTHALHCNPVSPMTRQPMRVDQLIENRELRQEIETLLCNAETVETEQIVQDDSPVCTGEVRAADGLTQVSVSVTDGEAPPLSIAFVNDTSGSMNREVKTANGETDGYNMLDIACHGTAVCINSLRSCDRAGVISFNSRASMVSPLRKMTPGNKGLLKVSLSGLGPAGSTNLWDGIKTALEMLPEDGIVCILTDGEPTVRPPKGELRMFNEWRDAHPNWHGQVHTFGFGYSLDSKLLTEISRAGNGRYSFIPDSSLVGSVFVHSMANIRTTHSAECILSVETEGEITGIGPHTKTSWGYRIPMGPLMFGQRRDYFLQCASRLTCTIEGCELSSSEQPPDSDDRQRTALAIYDSLRVRPNLSQFAATISEPHLLEDINGQWTEAMDINSFQRWGRHYLPSLAAAHLSQTCNNFLDKGIQTYGGTRFHELRDAFDKLLNEMAAPRATLRQYVEQRARSRGIVANAAPSTMASYNDRSGPCFPGWCTVINSDGHTVTLASLKRGDKIQCPTVTRAEVELATVRWVLKTMCPRGTANLVQIGKLYATPWHPIKPFNNWVFPISLGEARETPCEAVYSLLLDKPSCLIEGMECIGLAHGIENDPVASHAFFGTGKVKQMLEILSDDDSGLVVLPGPGAIQRGSDGLVCGFVV